MMTGSPVVAAWLARPWPRGTSMVPSSATPCLSLLYFEISMFFWLSTTKTVHLSAPSSFFAGSILCLMTLCTSTSRLSWDCRSMISLAWL